MIKNLIPGIVLLSLGNLAVASTVTSTDFETCLLQALADSSNDVLLVSQLKMQCEQPTTEKVIETALISEDTVSESSFIRPPGVREFFTPYKRNYIVFGSMQNKNGGEPFSGKTFDIRFEFGMKFRLFQNQENFNKLSPLYFGYSQKSWWDIAESSAPFKEHNYNPEIFWDFNDTGSEDALLPDEIGTVVDRFGFEHQSNGRDGPQSRSWDRLYAQKTLRLRDDLSLRLKAWQAMNEGEENIDITDYLGNGEVQLTYEPNKDLDVIISSTKGHERSKYNYQLDLVYTMGSWFNTKFMVSYYDGYGEALASFDEKTRSLRAGIFIPVLFNR